MKKKRIVLLAFVLGGLLTLPARSVFAQDNRDVAGTTRSTLESLRDSIKIVSEDIRLLQHILEASTTDQRRFQHTRIKSWIIGNPELRDSLFYALVAIDSSVQSEAGAEAEVVATETNDILEVRFGTAVFKGSTLRDALEKSSDKRLYQKIGESRKYSKEVELRDPAFKIPTSFDPELTAYDVLLDEFTPVVINNNPEPIKGKIDLSLYGLIFKIGPKWGGEIRVGSDELGFPFWSSGKTTFLATYKRVKFGFELPFRGGRYTSEVFPPFSIRKRKLNGTRGLAGEFDFGPAGGSFSVTRMTEHDIGSLTDPNDFAYIAAFAQLYYSFGVSLNPTNHVRVKVGMGYHRIRQAYIDRRPLDSARTRFEESITHRSQSQYSSALLKFEYVNKDINEKFGASLQFYEFILSTTAWLEIVPNTVRLELKYAWPIVRDLRKWENTDFVILSPHIRFSF